MKHTIAALFAGALLAGCAQYPVPASHPGPAPAVVPADTYVVGAHRNLVADTPANRKAALVSVERAHATPATTADVARSTTADLNHDGFVTTDEVVALSRAGLDDLEIVRRLEATGHVFEVTEPKRDLLLRHGVAPEVVAEIRRLSIA